MSRSFPQHFDLRLFDGPRAKQFVKPEDAFQQLIGDALKEMAGPCAHISPTKGRDGSIDSFVAERAPLSGPFSHLPLPLIVECKTHETVENVDRNILVQWGRMKSKLTKQALNGWSDSFEPWLKARGYAYCVSAHIQNKNLRDKLTEAIQTFFASLPTEQRPPIEFVRVVDWSDLRQWLETLPHVSDAWLSIELELILDHATYLSSLTGVPEYLLSSKLHFVPPADDSPFLPDHILNELEGTHDERGLLLFGAGGVGKTRTVVEVGTLAANKGWRVLHVLPYEPGLTTQDIARVVLPYHGSRTLLIFDYLDQMQTLDLGGIRHLLIPEAAKRGIRLRLLANSRPAWMALASPDRDQMFRVTEIRPTQSQRAALTASIASTIAPTACRLIGQEEVIRLCGSRAIIAVLVARELESRAHADLLKDINIGSFRSGDLSEWLQRRLRENSLSVKGEADSLEPIRPKEPMAAAAAVLGCIPDSLANLELAAESVYDYFRRKTAKGDAKFLVQSLIRLGWLETNESGISTAHDVVADEVLDQTIHTDSMIFENEFSAVLSSVLRIPEAIGRLGTALRRVIGAVQNEEVAREIGEFQQRWLMANATALSNILRAEDSDVIDYALDASLARATSDDSTIPGTDEDVSLWLEQDHPPLDAGFAIPPLLERTDLSVEDSERATDFALLWLAKYHTALEAGFVLKVLLQRRNLSAEDFEKATDFALLWLKLHQNTLEAGLVLESLLEHMDD
jgi:hypothetical protein